MRNKSKLIIASVLLSGFAFIASGCNEDESTNIERAQQEQSSLQAVKSVGMPAITMYAEKAMMKTILESRDHMYPTYTYLFNAMQGTIGQKICDSVGYGLNGATQYTNPSKVYQPTATTPVVIPQADPNGLYSPASTAGTWVLCKIPGKDKVDAQYIEPDVIVLTFPKESIVQ